MSISPPRLSSLSKCKIKCQDGQQCNSNQIHQQVGSEICLHSQFAYLREGAMGFPPKPVFFFPTSLFPYRSHNAMIPDLCNTMTWPLLWFLDFCLNFSKYVSSFSQSSSTILGPKNGYWFFLVHSHQRD